MAKCKPSATAKKASRSSKKVQKPAAPATKSARSKPSAGDMIVTVDRRRSERRTKKSEKREEAAPVAVERHKLERRTKVNRRRQIDPTTCEREYSLEEIEFMNALDDYKRTSGRMFPTCSEILEVFRKLGYVKQAADEVLAVAEGSPAASMAAEATFAPLGLFQAEQLLV